MRWPGHARPGGPSLEARPDEEAGRPGEAKKGKVGQDGGERFHGRIPNTRNPSKCQASACCSAGLRA